MVRVGEDVSEKLDIVPAEFFVHRHVHGKWACECCQVLVQEPVQPQIIDGASGLVAHTLISRFVDHLPYYRQEAINARAGVHTPRSTLAQWSGRGGAALEPLYDVHKRFVLGTGVLHADETPVAMLDPGAGKTKKRWRSSPRRQTVGLSGSAPFPVPPCNGGCLHGRHAGAQSVFAQDSASGAAQESDWHRYCGSRQYRVRISPCRLVATERKP